MRPVYLIIVYLCQALLLMSSAVSLPHNNITHSKLKNGLEIYINPITSAHAINIDTIYKVGGINEPNGLTGISHLLEHMLFLGTKRYPNNYITTWVEQQGGYLNAATTQDYTYYTETIIPKNLKKALQIEADRMHNLRFTQKGFSQELAIVKQERLARYGNSPEGALHLALTETAFTNSPYHHPVIGWEYDLNHLKLKDAKHWYHQWYQPKNAIIIITGKIAAKNALRLINHVFGHIKPTGQIPKTLTPIQKNTSRKKVVIEKKSRYTLIKLSFLAPSFKSSIGQPIQPYALSVGGDLIAGNKTSSLYQLLVTNKKVAKNVFFSYYPYTKLQNLATISIITSNQHKNAAIKYALTFLKKKHFSHITKENIKDDAVSIFSSIIFNKDSLSGQSAGIMRWVTQGLPYKTEGQIKSTLDTLTKKQVTSAIHTFLNPNIVTIAVLNSRNKNAKL